MSELIDWTTRKLANCEITVGLCAWRLSMLAGEDAEYVKSHPSLIVVDPADEDALLASVGRESGDLPVLLGIAEPAFSRQLEGEILRRMALLGRQRVDALVLHVEDPAEVKSGGMLQTLFTLREKAVTGVLGLAHPDGRAAEWLSQNAAVRLLGVNYSLEDQSAAFRTLDSAREYGMDTFGLVCPESVEAIRFALAEHERMLAVLDRPIPAGLEPMTEKEREQAWNNYKLSHSEPAKLPRGLPPEVE